MGNFNWELGIENYLLPLKLKRRSNQGHRIWGMLKSYSLKIEVSKSISNHNCWSCSSNRYYDSLIWLMVNLNAGLNPDPYQSQLILLLYHL